MFKVGDEVVCVDDSDTTVVKKGSQYVVDSVYGSGVFVRLVGIVSVTYETSGMYTRRFRKVERKTETLTRWLSQPVGDTDNLDKSKRRVGV